MKKMFKLFGIVALSSLLATSCINVDESTDNGVNNGNSNFIVNPNDFKGDINVGNVTLQSNTIYKLTGPLVINEGTSLTIPAGTRIEATGGTSAYIVVTQGGKIYVNGTASNPVVMTSANASPAPGDWGGLVICGKAPINSGATASAEVSGYTYGGTLANDNSGVLQYLRIEYPGAIYNANKEFNGLSLFGVGNGTVIDYVQVFRSSDDGYEFFGGTVNTSHLVSSYNEDDQFDWTEGWNGTNTYWFGKLGNNIGNRGIEADNLEANFDATPIANPTINNLTLIGLGNQGSEPDGIKLRRGTKAQFSNVVIDNFATGINIEHDQTIAFIPAGLFLENTTITNITNVSKGKNTLGTTVDVTAAFSAITTAGGAGNGTETPSWTAGWTTGL
ncbi:hypothetical protein [Flavobacterium psychraquaticum]|uniref:hypothetical protein n=1 Tax=Flavobacterium psychraquaticum TaxID=3103958 RepID=UPI002ACED358|nr:hypothetical protein [Flavobacterium sp. LB-N7T]